MSKFLDENGLLYLWQQLKARLAGKVDRETGKGLSANDYTDAEKAKLAGVAEGANQTVINNTLTSASDTQALSAAQGKALKEQIDALEAGLDSLGDLTGVYRYRGSVASEAALPAGNNGVGDVYNVEDTGMNYGWTGEVWDALGQVLSVDAVTNAEIDAILQG